MAEANKNEMVPVSTEVEVIDTVDDQSIVEMMTGQAIQDYVYSFKQGGRVVEGLTLAGINEAANRRGGIQVNEINYEEKEHSWVATATAIDTVTGNSRFGAYEQPKMLGGRKDPFAFTKAIHKAQRNAIKQLLPMSVIRDVLNFYLHRKVQDNDTEQPQTEQNGGNITNAQKASFAIANKLADRLGEAGVSKEVLWDYVKQKFGVEKRNDMTEMQWTQLAAELKAAETTPKLFDELVKRVKEIEAANTSTGDEN